MQKVDAVIAVAGWEERFHLGLKRDLEDYRPAEAIVLCFEEYSEVTAGTRESVREAYGESGAGYFELSVPRNPVEIWRRMRDEFSQPRWSSKTVLVDITTMPREVIY